MRRDDNYENYNRMKKNSVLAICLLIVIKNVCSFTQKSTKSVFENYTITIKTLFNLKVLFYR